MRGIMSVMIGSRCRICNLLRPNKVTTTAASYGGLVSTRGGFSNGACTISMTYTRTIRVVVLRNTVVLQGSFIDAPYLHTIESPMGMTSMNEAAMIMGLISGPSR